MTTPQSTNDEVHFPEWRTVWPRCRYRVIEAEVPDDERSLFISPFVIEAVPYSPVEEYDPLTGRPVIEGDPPHLALANLDTRDTEAVVRFCNQYGLLGLREIPRWRNYLGLSDDLFGPNTRSAWLNTPRPEPKPKNWHWIYSFREPLDLFREVVDEYQSNFELLRKMSDEKTDQKQRISLSIDLQMNLTSNLQGCTVRPYFDGERWLMGYQFRSLLEACYFHLVLDMIQSKNRVLRRCNKCGRYFFASERQLYCSPSCRGSAASARMADRVVKARLRDLYRKGRITKELLDEARAEVDRLYDRGNPNGIKNAEVLDSEIAKFIKSRLESRSSDLSPRKDDEHGAQARKR